MLHVYAITDVRDGSIVSINRSTFGAEIVLVGHTSVVPHLGTKPLSPGDLEAALAQTAWVIIDYPTHEHAGKQMPAARLKVSREYLGT
ncbi:hypothetical protein [Sphingomonas sp. 3-13AW]|uniref:hypothetical protein n=1 Tax=Sphingomonas sp. 3-13AW TaxID=3050450 RepID=UPI003BB4FE04